MNDKPPKCYMSLTEKSGKSLKCFRYNKNAQLKMISNNSRSHLSNDKKLVFVSTKIASNMPDELLNLRKTRCTLIGCLGLISRL